MRAHIQQGSESFLSALTEAPTNLCLVCNTVQLTYGVDKTEVRYIVEHKVNGLVCTGSHQSR